MVFTSRRKEKFGRVVFIRTLELNGSKKRFTGRPTKVDVYAIGEEESEGEG